MTVTKQQALKLLIEAAKMFQDDLGYSPLDWGLNTALHKDQQLTEAIAWAEAELAAADTDVRYGIFNNAKINVEIETPEQEVKGD